MRVVGVVCLAVQRFNMAIWAQHVNIFLAGGAIMPVFYEGDGEVFLDDDFMNQKDLPGNDPHKSGQNDVEKHARFHLERPQEHVPEDK